MQNRAQTPGRTQNLVVAKYRTGRMVKGVTYNFGAEKKAFHVIPLGEEREEGGVRKGFEALFSELKAIFLLKILREGKSLEPLMGF